MNHPSAIAFLLGMVILSGCDKSKPPEAQRPSPEKVTDPRGEKDQPGGRVPPVSQTPEKENAKEEVPNGPPVYKVTAKKVSEELIADSDVFKKKYENKMIELIGVVDSFSQEDNRVLLFLKGADDIKFGRVLCILPTSTTRNLVLPGQTVRVLGQCKASIMAFLQPCKILEVTGDPPPSITADALAKTFAENPRETEEKWKNKFIIVTGIVKEVTKEKGKDFWNVLLESTPASPMIEPNVFSEREIKDVRPGQQIRILCKTYGLLSEPTRVFFHDCTVLSGDRK